LLYPVGLTIANRPQSEHRRAPPLRSTHLYLGTRASSSTLDVQSHHAARGERSRTPPPHGARLPRADLQTHQSILHRRGYHKLTLQRSHKSALQTTYLLRGTATRLLRGTSLLTLHPGAVTTVYCVPAGGSTGRSSQRALGEPASPKAVRSVQMFPLGSPPCR
jgi:hypothetical protein